MFDTDKSISDAKGKYVNATEERRPCKDFTLVNNAVLY